MFTGLVGEIGRLNRDPVPSAQGGALLDLAHSAELAERLEIGASLAVAGVCLTVIERLVEGDVERDVEREVEHGPQGCRVEVSPETLRRTTLGALRSGGGVNLEASLRVGDPLGGHWVQGHVDGTTEVTGRRDLAEHRELTFAIPEGLEPYIVEKGSVALDGVSLTVSVLAAGGFEVALIPHTLEVTTFSDLEPGDRVNLEVDILAKYVRQALRHQ